MISITSKDVEAAQKLLRKLRKRGLIKAGLQAFALSMAEETRAELQAQLASSQNPASRALADSLVVKKVGVTDAGLFARPTPRTITIIERETTVIQVIKSTARPDRVIDYLVANGPWTIDTLPADPGRRTSKVIARQALQSDVEAIRARTDNPAHRRVVAGLGGAVRHPDAPIHEVVEDLSTLVTRGELGILRGISPSWIGVARGVSLRASTKFNAVAKDLLAGRVRTGEYERATPGDMRDAESMSRRMEA